MNTYRVTDPNTGVTLKLTGDSPPTEAELEQIFAQYSPKDEPGHIGHAMASGIPFGDEIAAAGAATVGKVLPESMGGFPSGTSFMDAYTEIREDILSDTEAFAERNPKTALAAQLGTAVATGAAAAPRIAATIPGSAATKTVGAAAVEGAAFGAGDADPGERLKGAGVGASVSAGTAGLLNAAGRKAADGLINRTLKSKAPTAEQLKSASQALYDKSESLGVVMSETGFKRLLTDMKGVKGYSPTVHKVVRKVLKEISDITPNPTLKQVDEFRQLLNAAAENGKPGDQRIVRLMVNRIDDFLSDSKAADFVVPSKEAVESLGQARELWSRVRKDEILRQAIEIGQDRASGVDLGTRNEFGTILRRIQKGKLKGFTDEEVEAIRNVATGTTGRNLAQKAGRLGFGSGRNVLIPALTAGAAGGSAMTGNPLGLAVPLAASAVNKGAQRATVQSAELASALTRAGSNGRSIVKAYLKHADKRSPQDLAQLLIGGDISKVKISQFPRKDWSLVRQALNIAASGASGLLGQQVLN